MGKTVLVTKLLDKHRRKQTVRWLPRKIPGRAGWIVGTRFLNEGEVKKHYCNMYYDPPETYRYLDVTNRVRCLLVCFSPYENARHVPMDGYEIACVQPAPVKWSESDPQRKELSEMSKGWARDSKGRWIKE